MIRFLFSVFLFGLLLSQSHAEENEKKLLTPQEARAKVGERITLRMEVKSAKDRLEKRGEIYLDADLDFKSKDNFAVVITRDGAANLKAAGIDDPAEFFRERLIEATGIVKVVDDVPRIEIDDAKQIARIDKK